MILVTGATGNVGSYVVRELRDQGVGLRAFVRDPAKAAERLGDGVELAVGDFSGPASVRRALDGVAKVFLACPIQARQIEFETGVIDAAAAAGVERIVKLSTVGAQVGLPVEFWDWHRRIEQQLRRSGVPTVILRPNFYMSNLLAAAESVRHQGRLLAPAGGARIAMIDPRDIAAVAAVALIADGQEGQTHVVTGPEAITYAEVAKTLSDVTGRSVEFVDVPPEVARESRVAAGMPDWYASNLMRMFGLLKQGVLKETTDTVRAVTEREPRSFAQFAHDHAELFRA